MCSGNILDSFLPFDEMERFYKAYYVARQNPDTLAEFLKSVVPDKFPANTCYIPDINDLKYDSYTEQFIFQQAQDRQSNILINRHFRYTPPYFHSHTLFEIVYVLSGSCKNTVEHTAVEMTEQDFCIIAPGARHSLEVNADDSIILNILIRKSTFDETFYHLLAKDNLLSAFFGQILYTGRATDYIIFHPAGDAQFRTLMEYLIAERFTEDDISPVCKDYFLMSAFGILLRRHTKTAERAQSHQTAFSGISEILRYIQNHYKEATLDGTARQFGYTAPYLSKIIKESTGMTYTELTADIRYKRACILLANTDMPVYKIADAVGYANPEQFYKFFKNKSGITPAQFRRGKMPQQSAPQPPNLMEEL